MKCDYNIDERECDLGPIIGYRVTYTRSTKTFHFRSFCPQHTECNCAVSADDYDVLFMASKILSKCKDIWPIDMMELIYEKKNGILSISA